MTEPAPRPQRDFGELAVRVEALQHPLLRRRVVGESAGYPIYRLDLGGEEPAPRRWLVTSGTHGDEPAGPPALLEFLEGELDRVAGHADLVILPCINPWGYVHDRRENADAVDINRSFEDDGTSEAVLVKRVLAEERFDFFVEFHEDWEFRGYYLFECRGEDHTGIGTRIVDRVRPIGPIYEGVTLEEMPIRDGVVTATEAILDREVPDMGQQALPLWLFRTGRVERSITSETPSSAWDLPRRIAAHRAALDVCLSRFLEGES